MLGRRAAAAAARAAPAIPRERIPVNALEDLIILLLGSSPNPMPSRWHLQKEMYVLARASPKLGPLICFEPHYNGPYSHRLQEASSEPFHRAGAYRIDRAGRMRLTEEGRRIFDEKVADAGPQSKLADLLIVAEMIRMLYDKLSVDELLFLICSTYPEETGHSNMRDSLFKDDSVRRRLADSLLKKDMITQGRHGELIAGG